MQDELPPDHSDDDDEVIGMSMTTMLRCGKITMEDDHVMMIQNVSLNVARQIARVLVEAMGDTAELQWMTMGRAEEILVTPEQRQRELKLLAEADARRNGR